MNAIRVIADHIIKYAKSATFPMLGDNNSIIVLLKGVTKNELMAQRGIDTIASIGNRIVNSETDVLENMLRDFGVKFPTFHIGKATGDRSLDTAIVCRYKQFFILTTMTQNHWKFLIVL